ncbi:DUF397 domain-containing protein [Streptomyces sp. ISL-44]|nr:DUF397 domain-containing protein [Streptomyces sp. ISL-44]
MRPTAAWKYAPPPRRGKTRIRDSKDLSRPPLICTTESWMAFVRSVGATECSDGQTS